MKVLVVIGLGNQEPRASTWKAITDADLVIRVTPNLQAAYVIKDREAPAPYAAQILHSEQ